jgi:hypothetical protein
MSYDNINSVFENSNITDLDNMARNYNKPSKLSSYDYFSPQGTLISEDKNKLQKIDQESTLKIDSDLISFSEIEKNDCNNSFHHISKCKKCREFLSLLINNNKSIHIKKSKPNIFNNIETKDIIIIILVAFIFIIILFILFAMIKKI